MGLPKLKNWNYPELDEIAQAIPESIVSEDSTRSADADSIRKCVRKSLRWRLMIILHGSLFGISLSVAYFLIIPLLPANLSFVESALALIDNFTEKRALPVADPVPSIPSELLGISPLWLCNGSIYTNNTKGLTGCESVGSTDLTVTSRHRYFTPPSDLP